MAQFIASIKGNRAIVTRLGGKTTGLAAALNGWNAGLKITSWHENGEDKFILSLTGGSNNGKLPDSITLTENDIIEILNGRKTLKLVELEQNNETR